ncbi:MAG: DUF6088 family protein [Coriobacteriales bacterium]|jgi:hypothetical protein|nr:DUF6088 family protein [Coriobacteriales bacterium]
MSRISAAGEGAVFVAADFFDLGQKDTVYKALLRLAEDGTLQRPMRGLYLYPEYSRVLGKSLTARPERMAEALARNYNWTISPYGETALNQLGLSAQVPAVYQYVSDGPNKSYAYGNFQIVFTHRANRETTHLSPKTRLAIHALKALGKDSVDGSVVERLSSVLTDEDKQSLLKETQYSSSWIHDIAKDMSRE